MKSGYDAIARAYCRYWGPFSVRRFLPVLEQLLLPRLPEEAHILDLGCGTGNLARVLWEKGYHVTGVDISLEMVREARNLAPDVEFLHQDMRTFKRENTFHATIALFATLNHLLKTEDLWQVLNNVKSSLINGGWFVFDFNTTVGLQKRWQGTEAVVEKDMVIISQGSYDNKTEIAETIITYFRAVGTTGIRWLRNDTVIKLRGYDQNDIREMLEAAGFDQIILYKTTGKIGQGREFAICRKPD